MADVDREPGRPDTPAKETIVAASAPNPQTRFSTRRWWALGLIAAAQFVVIMDPSIIGVALPHIRESLGFDPTELSWVFNAYVVAFGGLLLLGGRLSDLLGARRVFAAGWATLLVGSVIAGSATTVAAELTGRAVQGAGAAPIAPAALTLLMVLFGREPKELMKALSVYGAAAPAGGTAGVFLGGVLTQYASWPWVFYINVPLATAALLLPRPLTPAVPASRSRLDLFGAATATAGLTATVYTIVRAPEVGWTSARTLVTGGIAVVLLSLFVRAQATGTSPLLRLGIFRERNLSAANVAQFLLGAAWIPMWFFLNLYLQQVLGLGAFASGAALQPMTVVIMVLMVTVAPRMIGRYGPKNVLVTGMSVLAAGMAALSFVRPSGSFWVDVLPASLVAATGMAFAFIPSLGIALSSARPEEGGLAAGLVNTSYQVGSALGLAVTTALATSHGAKQLGNISALTSGYAKAFVGAGVVAVAGAILAGITLWTRPAAPAPSQGAPAGAPAHAA